MSSLFDNHPWSDLTQAVQKLAYIQMTSEQAIHVINSFAVQQQIELFKLPIFEFGTNLIDATISYGPQIDTLPLLNTLRSYSSQISRQNQLNILEYASMLNTFKQIKTHIAQVLEECEVVEHPETELSIPETYERIVICSPSLLLLEQLRAQRISLHDLTWRQFEEIVAELLIKAGYQVELGRGTKDGGKDIVAVKQISGLGLVMSVWQAKKLQIGNKVDIHVIRELADTRLEQNASKGVIVTTTSLTKDALARIERDRYYLHKVDGNDLHTWIQTGQQR